MCSGADWSPNIWITSSLDFGALNWAKTLCRSLLESIIGPLTSWIGRRRYLYNKNKETHLNPIAAGICYADSHLLAWIIFSPRLAVNTFNCDWFWFGSDGPISTLWKRRLPSCFKNVIFMEQPSPAPTPLSRNIFWACSKFEALNRALVIKWRARFKKEKKKEAEIISYCNNVWGQSKLRVFPLYKFKALNVLMEKIRPWWL